MKDHSLANAPAYQHPRRVWFLDELPLAGTNKIDRKALVQPRYRCELTEGKGQSR